MLSKILNLRKDELVRGSFVLFVMINVFNFLNYIFHFAMARMLSVADYGILAVLMSFIYIFGIPTEAIQTSVSKYTSNLKDNGKIKDLMYRGLKKLFKISVIVYVLFIPIAFFSSYFLDIKIQLILFIGLMLFVSIILPLFRGIIQGKKDFNGLGFSMNTDSVVKLIIAIILVYYLGNVYGAISGVLIGALVGFFVSLFFLKDIFFSKRRRANIKGIYSYSWPTLVLFKCIMLVLSLDIIIAKRFFVPEIAGQYAVASILGKMIFFGTVGIGKAMFPISSEKKKKKDRKDILNKSLLITIGLCLIALLIFIIFPKLVIKILFGEKYIDVSNIIVYTGGAFSLLSITNLIILHKLSYGKVKNYYFILIFVLTEVLLLSIFSQNLINFSIAFLISNFLLLIGSLFLKVK